MTTDTQQIHLFQSADGYIQFDVALDQDTVWLSLEQMVLLFERDKSVISRHLSNLFKEGELVRDSVVAKNATTASDGKTYQVTYFNLDVVISIGYRVKSQRGVQFRQWATIEQGFGDELFYPNVASRAANLLYLVIKNHPLADGNKRTGSFLFLWYLRLNEHLLAKPTKQLINDNTLVALALLVAESKPEQKELMIRLIEHFILLKKQ
jgi:prophage maintenance system killer protein